MKRQCRKKIKQQQQQQHQQPTTNNQRPTTNDQRPTTNDQRPTTNDQRPTTNNQQPTTNNQQPTTTTTATATARTRRRRRRTTTTTTTTTTAQPQPQPQPLPFTTTPPCAALPADSAATKYIYVRVVEDWSSLAIACVSQGSHHHPTPQKCVEPSLQQDHHNGEIKTLEEVDQQTNQQEKDHVGNISQHLWVRYPLISITCQWVPTSSVSMSNVSTWISWFRYKQLTCDLLRGWLT